MSIPFTKSQSRQEVSDPIASRDDLKRLIGLKLESESCGPNDELSRKPDEHESDKSKQVESTGRL